ASSTVTSPARTDFGTESRNCLPASLAVIANLVGVVAACLLPTPPQPARPTEAPTSSANATMLGLRVSFSLINFSSGFVCENVLGKREQLPISAELSDRLGWRVPRLMPARPSTGLGRPRQSRS